MEHGQGEVSLCEVVVCGLGWRSLAWVVWLAGARVLWLAGSQFRGLVVGYGAVLLHHAMGAAGVMRIGKVSVGLVCIFWVCGLLCGAPGLAYPP